MPKLKAAQRWILEHVVERLPVHGKAHGFLAGRSIATNAAAHVGSKIILKVDLKDFFPTITFRRAKGIFRK
ncbi:MAG: RNA-directed DNA polymerase, partial [Byssovorax sp.]